MSVGGSPDSVQTGGRSILILCRGDGRLSCLFFGGEESESEARVGDDKRLPLVETSYDNATGTMVQTGDEGTLGTVLALVK